MHRETVPAIAIQSPASTWGRVIAWGVLVLVWFGSLGWRALISPDEGRYATIALGMLQSGDWLTPRLNGLLYFEKPILQYWIGAGSLQVFGINEFAARLWPGLTGFLTIIAVALTARRLWGEQAGHYVGLVAAGTSWIIVNSHFLSLDMGLTFFLTLALCGFLLAHRDGVGSVEQRHAMWLCWAAMAGATLSKGLVGLVIPGATLVLYSLIQRQFDFWRRMHWLSGLMIYFALTAPWFIAVSLKNPGFFDFFFIREHFRRFLTDEARRTGSIYYFVPYLLAGQLPWTTLLPGLFRRGGQGGRNTVFQPLRLLLIWSAFIFVFFSVSRSKLPSYILPIFPALALLVAAYWENASRKQQMVAAGLMTTMGAIGLAFVPAIAKLPKEALEIPLYEAYQPWVMAGALIAIIGGMLALFAAKHNQRDLSAVLLAIAGFLAGQVLMLGHNPLGHYVSGLPLVPAINAELSPGTKIYALAHYDQTMPFYLRRTMTLVENPDEFEFGLKQEPQLWLPTREAFIAEWIAGPKAIAITRPDVYADLQKRGVPMRLVTQDARRVVIASDVKK